MDLWKRSSLIGIFWLIIGSFATLASLETSLARTPDRKVLGAIKPAMELIRSLYYEQLVDWQADQGVINEPVISQDGSTIAFSVKGKKALLYKLDLQEASLTTINLGVSEAPFETDLSFDGSVALLSDNERIQIVYPDRKVVRELVRLTSPQITVAELSHDGSKAIFSIKQDTTFPSGKSAKRGIWMINADGTDLKQIVSAERLADKLGIQIGDVHAFSESGRGMDVSPDGKQLIFTVHTLATNEVKGGERLFFSTMESNSISLLAGPFSHIYSVGLSGNGLKAAYIMDGPQSTLEARLIDTDGKNEQVIANNPPIPFADNETRDSLIQLNQDGSEISFGRSGILYFPEEQAFYTLRTKGPNDSGFSSQFTFMTMDKSGDQFVYTYQDEQGVSQLALLAINTKKEIPIEKLTFRITPETISRAQVQLATVEADLIKQVPILGVAIRFYYEGLFNSNVHTSLDLFDDGQTRGDKKALDNTWTNNTARADKAAPIGKWTARVIVEGMKPDGLSFAYAIEMGMIKVVD